MTPEDQDRVAVVLVRARNPSNIGAVARAMHDLGFSDLRVVNDFPVPFAAAKSAVDASSVLHAAREHPTVAEAVADCTFVIGTTAVGERALEHPLHTLAQASPLIADALAVHPQTRVALLFGSEKTGLSNDELSHCHALLTIPMNVRQLTHDAPRHVSMNLGQAVAVCLYALREQAQPAQPTAAPAESPATAADLERLTSLLSDLFAVTGYSRRHPANSRETNVRRLIRRMALTASDSAVWSGVFRHMLRANTAHPKTTADLTASNVPAANDPPDTPDL